MANKKTPFSNIELSFFCNQLAMILTSGISLMEGLTMMHEEVAAGEEKEILSDILNGLIETGNLHTALKDTELFPAYMLQMVKIGEETGKLDDVMTSLGSHYEREDSIRSSIRQALIYPIIMISMMLLVIIVLLVKVMPIFNQVFIQLGSEMTGFSGVLVNLGNNLQQYSMVFIVILVLLVAGIIYLGYSKKGKSFLMGLCYRFNFTRALYEKIAACRFASGMALALSSGLNPDLSMELVCELNEDTIFQKKLDTCRAYVAQGEDLSQSLLLSGIFTGIYARMASIGGKAGTMDQVMSQIAVSYQDEIDTRMNQLLAIIEPTLVILLSLIVGVVLMSVMFPLIGMMSNM